MRTSKPYVERFDEVPDTRAGDYVERDDGWWRAYSVTVYTVDGTTVQAEVEWWPTDDRRSSVIGRTPRA